MPALREELVTALIRSLPKDLRRNFVPAPDTARAVLPGLDPGQEPLLEALQRELHAAHRRAGPVDAFDLDKLPAHLRVTFAVDRRTAARSARGKDLEALRSSWPGVRGRPSRAVATARTQRAHGWPDDLDELPRTVERISGGHTVRGFPALVDAGATVDVRVFATTAEQAAMGPGTRGCC